MRPRHPGHAYHLLVDHGVPGPVLGIRDPQRPADRHPARRRVDRAGPAGRPGDPRWSRRPAWLEVLGLAPDDVVAVARGRTDLLVEVVDAGVGARAWSPTSGRWPATRSGA